MKPKRRLYRPGRLPVLRYLIADLLLFRSQGYGWRMAWRSALDYWRFDRGVGN